MAELGTVYTPSQTVEHSGIYDVMHDTSHSQRHQVTCVYGEPFPPCHGCGKNVRFRLAIKALHLTDHENFKKK